MFDAPIDSSNLIFALAPPSWLTMKRVGLRYTRHTRHLLCNETWVYRGWPNWWWSPWVRTSFWRPKNTASLSSLHLWDVARCEVVISLNEGLYEAFCDLLFRTSLLKRCWWQPTGIFKPLLMSGATDTHPEQFPFEDASHWLLYLWQLITFQRMQRWHWSPHIDDIEWKPRKEAHDHFALGGDTSFGD